LSERSFFEKSLSALGKPRGWPRPESESSQTPDLLAEAGIEYVCDWVNDDLPYLFKQNPKNLYACRIPTTSTTHILIGMHHDEDEFRDQVIDQFESSDEESAGTAAGSCRSRCTMVIGRPTASGRCESAAPRTSCATLGRVARDPAPRSSTPWKKGQGDRPGELRGA